MARFCAGWPPKEFQAIQDNCFITMHYCDDEEGYRIFWWVDNNKVTIVSTIHTGEEAVKITRKRPRKNATNKHHLPLLFGDKSVAEFKIPGIIYDYNYKMKGVNLSDQLIAYYRPQVRCQCNWLAMFLHGLDVIHVNSYIVTSWEGTNSSSQKQYLTEYIESLISCANAIQYRCS